MKKIVCEMCECTEFVKVDGMFECQGCGCKYSVEDARKMMQEVAEEKTVAPEAYEEEQQEQDPFAEYARHTKDSPNRITVQVIKVGHETYTALSVAATLWGETKPTFVAGPDVVGNIGTEIKVTNHAGKTIKYIDVFVTPYNSVGDEVCCTVAGHSTTSIRVTGPLPADECWSGYCENMWYNGSTVGAKVEYAAVEFMDGSKELFSAEDLTFIEEGNANMVAVNVSYTSSAGAAGALWYTMDGGQKITLMQNQTYTHFLKPGMHTLEVKNPFMKRQYTFQARDTVNLRVAARGLGMEFILL